MAWLSVFQVAREELGEECDYEKEAANQVCFGTLHNGIGMVQLFRVAEHVIMCFVPC